MSKFRVSKPELRAILLPEKYPSIEVAKKIRLPRKSNTRTKIDPELTPYIKAPISHIGDERVEWLMVVAPTQSGKTVILQVGVADAMDQNPVTSIYCLPDEKSGKRQVREKIIGMIENTPYLLEKVMVPHKTNLTPENIHMHDMSLYLAWSNSLASLSSTPAGRVFADEVRLFKEAIGNESNAIKLLNDRMTTFDADGDAQGMLVSTPSVEGDLLHQQMTTKGTIVLYFYTQCEHCDTWQRLNFFDNLIRYTKKGGEKATCCCRYCGERIDNEPVRNLKRNLNSRTAYGIEGLDGVKVMPVYPIGRRMMFRFDSMNSPFRSFQKIYNEFLETKDNINDYKNFIQCWLAEFWKLTESRLGIEDVLNSRVKSPRGEIPNWTKVLLGGVDTQDDGFYVVIRAFGDGMRSHLVDAFFIPYKKDVGNDGELTKIFRDNIEDRIYTTADGIKWGVALWAIDTGGHRTMELANVTPELDKVIPCKGRNTQNKTIISSENQTLYLVRTDNYAEETEIACLKKNFTVYENVEEDYFSQFINYKKIKETSKKNGNDVITWKKTGQNDYRMAEIHAFICLDIIYGNFSFRSKLNTVGWSHNPYVAQALAENKTAVPTMTDKDTGYMNYFSGDRNDDFSYNDERYF